MVLVIVGEIIHGHNRIFGDGGAWGEFEYYKGIERHQGAKRAIEATRVPVLFAVIVLALLAAFAIGIVAGIRMSSGLAGIRMTRLAGGRMSRQWAGLVGRTYSGYPHGSDKQCRHWYQQYDRENPAHSQR